MLELKMFELQRAPALLGDALEHFLTQTIENSFVVRASGLAAGAWFTSNDNPNHYNANDWKGPFPRFLTEVPALATDRSRTWIAVELPRKVTAIFRPFGGMSQTADLMLFGIHSTKYDEFLFLRAATRPRPPWQSP